MTEPEYQLLLFDLDGTLLDPERRIRPASLAVLRELMNRGVRVGLATGRSPRSVAPYVDELGPSGPLILLNGGMLWDPAERRAVHVRRLHRADAIAALEVALRLGIHVNTYIDDELFIARRTPISEASERKDGVPHRVVDDLIAHVAAANSPPFKLLMIRDRPEFDDVVAELRGVLHQPCTLVNSEPTYLEVMPSGVHKGAALEAIATHYGIPAHAVIAFGDGLNDAELLHSAGLGVAMANAHPRLEALADRVIGHHATDAIAEFLRGETVVRDGAVVLAGRAAEPTR